MLYLKKPYPNIVGASLVIVFVFTLAILMQQVYASTSTKPTVIISPDCGPSSGFSITFNANGFVPNGNVMWQFINSDDKVMLGPFGMFETNRTGGFSETTHTEEQSPDAYTIYFFDDVDNNGKLDQGGAKYKAKLPMPCKDD
jgi:hypothetical protein